MNSEDLITIIIPSYNHEDYVEHTIRSAIEQTYRNIELIVIDDCSPDSTCNVVEKLLPECRQRFTKVTFIPKNGNRGIQDSLNTAIDLAEGRFVLLVASDDILKENIIEVLYGFMKDQPAYALAGGNSELINGNGDRVYWDEEANSVTDIRQAQFKTYAEYMQSHRPDVDFLSDDYGSYLSLLKSNYIPSGYLIRKSAIMDCGKYNMLGFEDWHMHLQLSKSNKLKFVNQVLFSYRWHDGNMMKTAGIQSKGRETLMLERDYCYSNGFRGEWDRAYSALSSDTSPSEAPSIKSKKRGLKRRLRKIRKALRRAKMKLETLRQRLLSSGIMMDYRAIRAKVTDFLATNRLCESYAKRNQCLLSNKSIYVNCSEQNLKLSQGVCISEWNYITLYDQPDAESASILEVGEQTYIGQFNNIRASGSTIKIGSKCLIAQFVTIVGTNHGISASECITDQVFDMKKAGVTIGDDVWIGANATILPGAVIGRGAVVGAGSVVCGELEEYGIYVGAPAKLIKYRS